MDMTIKQIKIAINANKIIAEQYKLKDLPIYDKLAAKRLIKIKELELELNKRT